MIPDTSSVLIPFAQDVKTGKFVGIDEVPSGLACGCICLSCGMRVKARKDYIDGRVDHFAHHDKAEIECKISYWVSIRSIAEQILEQSTFICVPYLSSTIFKYAPIHIKSIDRHFCKRYQFTFDLRLITSIGEIYVYFLTGEGSVAGRERSYLRELPEYFTDALVLEIDIQLLKKNHHKAKSYLQDLLINHIENKKWITTSNPYTDLLLHVDFLEDANDELIEDLPLELQEEICYPRQSIHTPDPKFNYQHIKERLGIDNTNGWSQKDYKTCERIANFYHFMQEKEVSDYTRTDKYSVVFNGNNLWFICFKNEYFCVVLLGGSYIVYDLDFENELVALAKTSRFELLEKALIQYMDHCPLLRVGIQKNKLSEEDLLTCDRMIPYYRRMLQTHVMKEKEFIEEFKIIDKANKMLFVCYHGEYYGVTNIGISLLAYRVAKDSTINIITRVFSLKELEDEIKRIVDEEHDNLF